MPAGVEPEPVTRLPHPDNDETQPLVTGSSSPALPGARPSASGEVALLAAIDAALDGVRDESGRVALVRRYIGVALEMRPAGRRATFTVIAKMITRDITQGES
jgi:hypothetical protein